MLTQTTDRAGNSRVSLRKNNINTHQLVDVLYFQAFISTKK